jgi:EAL domain-containing protein (putative c-di-GMP-specific phosphodiesterase class I)
MRSKSVILSCAAAVVVALEGGCGSRTAPPPAPAQGANVLLISVDTLRADHLSPYGSTRVATPAIARLAGEGVRFASAYSPVPLTLPAHVSLLTGLLPPTHGVRDNGGYNLGEQSTTLADLLKRHGYATSAFVSAFVLDSRWERYATEMDEARGPTPAVSDLHRAIEAGAIDLHYQPILTLDHGRVASVEALVRWSDAAVGAVPAESIIRLAEDSGLIVKLGEYVLRGAIRQMQALDRTTGRDDLHVAVNVSPVQVHEGGLVEMVDRTLHESGFDPRRVDLELTERAAMRGVSALPTLLALKHRGVTLTLDDFGSGYSSLSRLTNLPIDAMKIDRSLLERVGEPRGEAIVRAIVAMARTLGRVFQRGV